MYTLSLWLRTGTYQDTCCRCFAFEKTGSAWRLPYMLCEDCFLNPTPAVGQAWADMLANFGDGAPHMRRACNCAPCPLQNQQDACDGLRDLAALNLRMAYA